MNRRSSLFPAGKATVAALLVAAAGFAIQIASGVDVPTVPPGLVIMLAAAALVAFGPWRLGVFVGAWVQFLAVIVAVVAGIAATAQNYRGRAPA